MFTLKIFYSRYDSRVETRAKLKTDLHFVKLIMQKVSYIPLENILADDPSQGLDFVPSRENHIWFSPDSFARINWFSFYDKIHNTAESNCYANYIIATFLTGYFF